MLFRVSDVYKSYGATDILRGASLQVNPGEHVGLVGRNGAGKTTLFKVISGEEAQDSGDVVRTRGLKLGLLAQHVHIEEGTTVHEAALAAFGRLQAIEHEMHKLEHEMADADADLEKVLERYSDLQIEFEREGGFEYAAKAESILQGLGFTRETWTMETSMLSGGQKNRLGMARLLLAEPDVLLLDEPTNHLDVAAVEWLEEFLSTYASAYVIISHDRYFLDRTCKRIVEVERGKTASYTGNYSHYLIEREERREIQQRAFENQQQMIAKTEEFIRKNLAGQKTKQAKSRRTMLAKLERVEAVQADSSQGNFQLKGVERAGKETLKAIDVAIGYEDKVLAKGIDFTLLRSEALGIIGPNGSGKTTLVKTLLHKLPLLAGELRWGSNTKVGYYAQQLDDLDERNEIIMELRRVAPASATAGELRGFLARFLFTGDDVYKHVRDLSGGEKGRLALAKLIYSQVNVLILDEPTNHLDIPSREALEEALDAYDGTIITISHDRFFLDRVATQILALDGKGAAEHFDGDYTQYHDWKIANAKAPESNAATNQVSTVVTSNAATNQSAPVSESKKPKVADSKNSANTSQSASNSAATKNNGVRHVKKTNKSALRNQSVIESDIAALEKRLSEITNDMAQPATARDAARLQTLDAEYKTAESNLQNLYAEWESAASETVTA